MASIFGLSGHPATRWLTVKSCDRVTSHCLYMACTMGSCIFIRQSHVLFFSQIMFLSCVLFIRSHPSPYFTVCTAIPYAHISATRNLVSLLLLQKPLDRPKNKKYIQLINIYKCIKVILQTGWLVDGEMFWQVDQRIKKWRPITNERKDSS
jgi:hypothetical protein